MACLEVVAAGARELSSDQYLAVNLSPRTLETDLFRPMDIVAIWARNGIKADRIVLEVTEREAIEDLDRLGRNLAACRALGMRIAADDVGAGNAGLRLLSQVPFDIVKIDLSLVQGGVLRDASRAVLCALGDLADRWNATVVAEGLETAQQLAAVRELGFSAAQGYLLGRPSTRLLAERVDIGALMASDLTPQLLLATAET